MSTTPNACRRIDDQLAIGEEILAFIGIVALYGSMFFVLALG